MRAGRKLSQKRFWRLKIERWLSLERWQNQPRQREYTLISLALATCYEQRTPSQMVFNSHRGRAYRVASNHRHHLILICGIIGPQWQLVLKITIILLIFNYILYFINNIAFHCLCPQWHLSFCQHHKACNWGLPAVTCHMFRCEDSSCVTDCESTAASILNSNFFFSPPK